jgi:hypothetical protein
MLTIKINLHTRIVACYMVNQADAFKHLTDD